MQCKPEIVLDWVRQRHRIRASSSDLSDSWWCDPFLCFASLIPACLRSLFFIVSVILPIILFSASARQSYFLLLAIKDLKWHKAEWFIPHWPVTGLHPSLWVPKAFPLKRNLKSCLLALLKSSLIKSVAEINCPQCPFSPSFLFFVVT